MKLTEEKLNEEESFALGRSEYSKITVCRIDVMLELLRGYSVMLKEVEYHEKQERVYEKLVKPGVLNSDYLTLKFHRSRLAALQKEGV